MELIHMPTPPDLSGYVESRIGGRSENQDSYGWKETPFGFLVTVCDGMGGGPGGKTASSLAVREIIEGVMQGSSDDTVVNILIKAVRRANMAILERGNENPALKGMGSTCTVLLINDTCATVAYVGDSRVYQLRGRSKVYRTFDHSLVFDLVRQKVITEEQARLSTQSNIITRALGAQYDVQVDVAELPYLSGDLFLLCTDGIHGAVPERRLIEMATDRRQSLGAVTDGIATTIDGEGRNSGGGHDNLTLAVIRTNNNSKLKQKMTTRLKILIGTLAVICCVSLFLNIVQAVVRGRQAENATKTSALVVEKEQLRQQFDQLQERTLRLESDLDALRGRMRDDSLTWSRRLADRERQISRYADEKKALLNEIEKLKNK